MGRHRLCRGPGAGGQADPRAAQPPRSPQPGPRAGSSLAAGAWPAGTWGQLQETAATAMWPPQHHRHGVQPLLRVCMCTSLSTHELGVHACAVVLHTSVGKRPKAQLCTNTHAGTRVHSGMGTGPCWVSVHVCTADPKGEQATAHMGPETAVPACALPGWAVGTLLRWGGWGGWAAPPRSGRRGATRPNCCLMGPRKPAASPLNRTTLSRHTHTHTWTCDTWHSTQTPACTHTLL